MTTEGEGRPKGGSLIIYMADVILMSPHDSNDILDVGVLLALSGWSGIYPINRSCY